MGHAARHALAALALLLAVAGGAAGADPDAGREINYTCAGCHGDRGQGGKKGEYPRIAGLHPGYIKGQLRKFRSRERVNIPMFPYTTERELPDEDIENVSAYLGQIVLSSQPPEFGPNDDALTRLKAMEAVMRIPRSEGDIDNGGKRYEARCKSCHGGRGEGRGSIFPMLTGQYTAYLARQVQLFRKGERVHDEDKKDLLDNLSDEDIRDILAHLTTLQD